MSTAALRVDVYSHHFQINHFGPEVRYALVNYCRQNLSMWGPIRGPGGRVSSTIKCVYIAVLANRTAFNFLNAQESDILAYLAAHGFDRGQIEFARHDAPPGLAETFTIKIDFVPRAYQPPIISYMVAPGCNKLVVLQTGKGKTFLALKAVQEIGKRTLLVIRPMYLDKWISDVEGFFDFKPGDLIVVRGGDSLRRVIELGRNGELKAKFIIFSNATLRMFLDEHEQMNGEFNSYGTVPQDLCKDLQAGLLIFDEVHQDFHFNYRLLSYLNVEKTIALSATMESDDPFINRRYAVAFPPETRSPEIEHDKYIAVEALFYEMESMEKMRYKNFFKQYNHALFEQSIMKNPRRLANYKRMVAGVVTHEFLPVYQPGMRCAVYFSTVEMCTIMQEHLSALAPNMVVNRYVSEDDYTKLLEADIAVTTMQSAGTAVDIPNLAININTIALNSKQANIQGLGRLRRLAAFPDFVPKFIYLVCTSIDKHMTYHRDKLVKFDGKVLGHKELQTSFRI